MTNHRPDNFRVYRAGTPPAAAFEARLLDRRREIADADDLSAEVRQIVAKVRGGGRAALASLVDRLDGVSLGPEELVVPASALAPASGEVPEAFRRAFALAVTRIAAYARAQLPTGFVVRDRAGSFEEAVSPLASVGCYVPGGRAAYPSTAAMTVVPAKVAGVARVVVATPPRAFLERAELRWALAEAGADEVLLAGGAHGLAALAFGIEGFEPVVKIVGPGNRWVNAAKKQLFGTVAVDSLAGPTEVVILADGSADPDLVAADLLAQAEHDPLAAAILVTADDAIVRPVAAALERRLAALPEGSPARRSIPDVGGALIVASRDEGLCWVERFAPEHLELMVADAPALARTIRQAGAIFVGGASAEVFGDYLAGPNHVLPTGGGARAFSVLSSADFVRRTSIVTVTPSGAAQLAPDAARLAAAEGLPAHAAAALARLPKGEGR